MSPSSGPLYPWAENKEWVSISEKKKNQKKNILWNVKNELKSEFQHPYECLLKPIHVVFHNKHD